MKTYTILIEIGTEELPAKILKRLGEDFFHQIAVEFKKNNIIFNTMRWFASSCHLAVKAKIRIQEEIYTDFVVNELNNNNDINHDGSDGYNENIYNMNNQLFLKHKMIESNDQKYVEVKCKSLSRQNKKIINNQKIKNLFNELINNALSKLTNYEMMRWSNSDTSFIRPVRTVTVLLDQYLIPGFFFDIKTNRVLYGHRCMGSNQIILNHADDYPEILIKDGLVMVDYYARKQVICLEVEKISKELGGFVDMKDKGLLEEIISLVEWPIVLFGRFDKTFLQLPSEVILHIMKCDQKYLPVYQERTKLLLPYFIFVANTVAKNHSHIITSHENAIKTRLIDADFFLRNDGQYRLENYISKLDSVLFHRKLGSLRDKVLRIEKLSGWIANCIDADLEKTKRAGYLCKCDLMSHMVFEFPSTQGTMGMYYALRDGEDQEVSLAQKEHYLPRFYNDILPTTHISCAVSIADKMDTITGIFGIKELPKGNRDPFALKRSALGVLRILILKQLSLDLISLIKESIKLYGSKLTNVTVYDDVHTFMYRRLYSWYFAQGYEANIVRSVLNTKCSIMTDIHIRINAVRKFYFLQKKEKNNILEMTCKRVSHFLLKQKIFTSSYTGEKIRCSLLKTPEEIDLFNKILVVEHDVELLSNQCRFYEALKTIATLCHVINDFFDKIKIMDSDVSIKFNRLMLLNRVQAILSRVTDISTLYN